jgi:hypothetical protein
MCIDLTGLAHWATETGEVVAPGFTVKRGLLELTGNQFDVKDVNDSGSAHIVLGGRGVLDVNRHVVPGQNGVPQVEYTLRVKP